MRNTVYWIRDEYGNLEFSAAAGSSCGKPQSYPWFAIVLRWSLLHLVVSELLFAEVH